jgi:short subunit dehydrogenase-like uncharacterized protein
VPDARERGTGHTRVERMSDTERMGRVILLGATGFTGQLIAQELAADGTPAVLAARDRAKLERLSAATGGLSTAVVDAADEAALAGAFRRGDVVINCVGPFTRFGEPVVRAAIGAGAHYLDTTGEQEFMQRTLLRYDRPAREAGVVVVNAMAFEYALGCCVAAVVARSLEGPVGSLDVVYSWRMGPGSASAGTRRSVLQVLTGPTLAYDQGEWRRERMGRRRRLVDLPGEGTRLAVNFPAGEVVTLPGHLDVRAVRGWISVGRASGYALALLGPLLPAVAGPLRRPLDWLLGLGPEGPGEGERAASRFTIVVEAVPVEGEEARGVLRGVDPYGLTAAIASRGARRILGLADAAGRPLLPDADRPRPDLPSGVLDAARLMDPSSFLDALRPRGLEPLAI